MWLCLTPLINPHTHLHDGEGDRPPVSNREALARIPQDRLKEPPLRSEEGVRARVVLHLNRRRVAARKKQILAGDSRSSARLVEGPAGCGREDSLGRVPVGTPQKGQ